MTNTMYYLNRRGSGVANIVDPPTDGGIGDSVWTAFPTAAVAYRGISMRTEGGAGVADTHAIVHKNVADAYSNAQFALTAYNGGYVGLGPNILMARTDQQMNLVDDTSTQALFPAANDNLTVQAGLSYRFRAAIRLTKGANSVSLNGLFNATGATFTTCNYISISTAAAAGTSAAAVMNNHEAATSLVWAAASTAVNMRIFLEGEFEVNAAGTIAPSVIWSGATGATPTVNVGTFFEFWPTGLNPVTAIGPWA